MAAIRWSPFVVIAFVFLSGCDKPSKDGSGSGSGASNSPASSTSGHSDDGWKFAKSDDLWMPFKAKAYGVVDDAKKGESFRVIVTSEKAPVDIRFYLYQPNGKEIELGKKEGVKEATMEGTISEDGSVMIQVSHKEKEDVTAHFQIERKGG